MRTEHLAGSLKKIIFRGESGHTVAELSVGEQASAIVIVGPLGDLAVGDELQVSGAWQDHPRFGRQFRVTHAEARAPSSEEGLLRYLSSGGVPGIGPALAERLVRHLGTELFAIAKSNPLRLSEVPGIGKVRAAQLARRLSERQAERELMVFLQGLGLGPGIALRVLKRYGQETLARVKADPYRLVRDVEGIGFATADSIAQRLGTREESPYRLAAGLLHLAQEASQAGDTVVPRQMLIERASAFLNAHLSALDAALEDLRRSGDLLVDQRGETELVGLTPLVHAELSSAKLLGQLLQQTPTPAPEAAAGATAGGTLSEEQQRAVWRAAQGPVCVITGGPGTGKTTVLKTLIALLAADGTSYHLCAPTGRAARRITETSGAEATTVHRLLGYRGGRFEFGRDNPLPGEVVIVDEASMVDVPLFYALLSALPRPCRLVLVGDADQLPSVGPGNVLGDIIASGIVPVARLTTIFRQAETSRIVLNAHRIRNGDLPSPSMSGSTGPGTFHLIAAQSAERAQQLVLTVCCERIPQAFGLDPLSDVQVLSPMHRGLVGTEALNQALQSRLNPQGSGLRSGPQELRTGDKVMQVKNDYDRDVFNGDIGRVLSVDAEAQRLLVDFSGETILYQADQLRQLSLAYCVSVHKSQGSEYPAIVLPLLPEHYLLLQRNLLYTAVTRAKQLVVIVGSQKALRIAVSTHGQSRRQTLLEQALGSHAPTAPSH